LGGGEPIKAGEFLLPAGASPNSILDILQGGHSIQRYVTIPEGMPSILVHEKLMAVDLLTGEIPVPAEGSVLPDTYDFARGESRAAVLARMQAAMKKELAALWAKRSPRTVATTPEEAVTLASIVEKETGRPDERTRVSAVFVNRLKTRMRLQSDPTIIYGLTGGKGALGRPIMKSEIEQATPYNTYVIDGLPPGPIANPGRASLEAAANPARTKELFFVADGTGGHVFSENYAEHQKNVAKLRAIEHGAAPAAASAPAPAPAAAPSGPVVIEAPGASGTPPNTRRNTNSNSNSNRR
jgi:UPF0755 protein